MRSLFFLALLACQRATPPALPSSAPSPEPASAPAPGLRATIAGGVLEVRDGAWVARVPAACAALVDLTVDGRERGLWLNNAIMRFTSDGALRSIHGFTPYLSHGMAGSSYTAAALLDLDGDGRFEIVERTTRFDDTGGHAEPPTVYAWAQNGFAIARGKKVPPASALFLGDRDPIPKAIGQAMNSQVRLLSLVSLSAPQMIGACDAPASLFAASAAPPAAGAIFAAVSYPRSAPEAGGLPLTLHVVRGYVSPPQVLASAEIGVLREAFTSEACRVRVRTGRPLLEVHRSARDPGRRVIVAVHAAGEARAARAFSWDGRALAAGAPIELDRCDTEARVPVSDPGEELSLRAAIDR